MTAITWPKIWIGSVTDESVGMKATIFRSIEDLLNASIEPSKYGSDVEEIHFVLIAVKPGNPNHPDDMKYDKKEKSVTIWKNLDLKTVLDAEEKHLTQLASNKIIEAINQIPKLNIQDLDIESLKDDITKLLNNRNTNPLGTNGLLN